MITGQCHHCQRVMCKYHTRSGFVQADRPPLPGSAGAQPVSRPAGRLVSHEFSGLGLEDRHAGAYHCDDHWHVVKARLGRGFWIGAGVIAVLGILVSLASLAVGLTLILAGAGLAVAGYLVDQRRMSAAKDARPLLPIIPNLESVSVLETLHGSVLLDSDGQYATRLDPVEGRIEIVMTLANSDTDRLGKYREKYEPAGDGSIEFSAGSCVVQGKAGIVFTAGGEHEPVPLADGTGISLSGNVASHPLFATTEGGSPRRWTARASYALHSTRSPASIPIWIVPSLVPASDRRTLELDLHWARLGDRDSSVVLDRFDEIELQVPVEWGNVEGANLPALSSNPEPLATTRTIRWNQPPPTEGSRGSLTLAIRFEEKIKLDEHGEQAEQVQKLTGKLKASFKGTLSGIEGIGVFRPLGDPWLSPPNASIKTEVTVDFELSLSKIRYQDVRVVPAPNEDDRGRKEVDEYAVMPNYNTVIDLTNDLSNSYYIKRVIENQPRGGGRAGLVNRFWDIAGRHYNGVFPIDFHITLTGEEQYEGGVRAHAGNTAVRITVQGSYVDDDMKQQIENVWDTLHDKVAVRLRKKASEIPSSPYSRPSAEDVPPSETAAPSASVPPPRDASHDIADRIAALRRRRDSATEALLEGRISEEIYRGVIADIEAELAGQ